MIARQFFLIDVATAMTVKPQIQILWRNFLPALNGNDRQSLVHAIQRRRRHENNIAARKCFPSAMAVESHPVGRKDERVLAPLSPQLHSWKRPALKNKAPVRQNLRKNLLSFGWVIQVAGLPSKINIDFLDSLLRGAKLFSNRLEHLLLPLWR